MTFHYNVDGGYPEMAGRASTKFKSVLKDLGVAPSVIRRVSIAMYEAGWSTASQEARELGFGAGMGFPNMKKYSDALDVQTEVGVGTTLTLDFLI